MTTEPMKWTRRRLAVPRHAEQEPAGAALLAAIDAVLALHVEAPGFRGCDGCHRLGDGGYTPIEDCPTRAAIEEHTRNLP